jgi:hypothetical protein
MKIKNLMLLIILLPFTAFYSSPIKSQPLKENPALEEKVGKFLAENPQKRQDMNIPSADGQLF